MSASPMEFTDKIHQQVLCDFLKYKFSTVFNVMEEYINYENIAIFKELIISLGRI